MPEGCKGFGDQAIVGPAMWAKEIDKKVVAQYGARTEELELPAGLPGPTVRINGLVESIRDGALLEVAGEDGRIALQRSLAALESIETGRVVRLRAANCGGLL